MEIPGFLALTSLAVGTVGQVIFWSSLVRYLRCKRAARFYMTTPR